MLGVSIATVSRALRDSHEVGKEMRQKVQDLAKKLNYRPNPFAQSLRQNKPKVIAVVLPNLVTHYYSAVLDGIEDYAQKEGYAVVAANSHEDHLREMRAIDNFIGMYVEGIIACLAQDTTDYSHFEEIHDMGIPLVFFARTCLPHLFSSVVSNGDEAARNATLHLLDNGSRRIARQAAIDLLQRKDRPDAILAFNDILTFAAFDAIKSLHLHIPEDVALVGFSEGESSAFVTPRLTVVQDRAYETGVKVCELLLKSIGGDKRIYKEVLPMTMEIRESSIKTDVDNHTAAHLGIDVGQ